MGHADGLSRQILKAVRRHSNCSTEGQSKIKVFINLVHKLLVTVEEIKVKSETEMKGQVRSKEGNKADLLGILNGCRMSGYPFDASKENIKRIPFRASKNV